MLYLLPKVLTVLDEGESKQFVRALEVFQVDEATEDVDRVFVEIGGKIRPRTENRLIFDQQLRPGLIAEIECPDIVEQRRQVPGGGTFTPDDNQHSALVIYASVASSGGRFQARRLYQLDIEAGSSRGSELSLKREPAQVIGVVTIVAFAPLTPKGVDILANYVHGHSDLSLDPATNVFDWQPTEGFQVEKPKLIELGVVCAVTAVNQHISSFYSNTCMTFSGRNGLLLFNLPPC